MFATAESPENSNLTVIKVTVRCDNNDDARKSVNNSSLIEIFTQDNHGSSKIVMWNLFTGYAKQLHSSEKDN